VETIIAEMSGDPVLTLFVKGSSATGAAARRGTEPKGYARRHFAE
jgi:hypothetical protein